MRKVAITAMIALLLAGCGLLGPSIKLTDEHIEAWIKVQRKLLQFGKNFGAQYAQNKEMSADDAKQAFPKLETYAKEAGFKNMQEFMKVNMEVAKSLSIASGKMFMSQLDKEVEKMYKQVLDQAAKMGPTALAQAKKQVEVAKRKRMEELKKNKPWADLVMEWAEKFGDKDNVKLIVKHMDKIQRVWRPDLR